MLEEYITRGKEKLRCVYTTGSCAAGAAKAAVRMLLSGAAATREELVTPKGVRLALEIEDARLEADRASCAVRKDSGDDPDITNGILVYAEATRIPHGIEIDGGDYIRELYGITPELLEESKKEGIAYDAFGLWD